MADHRTFIRPADDGGFTVTVEPALDRENFDGAYPTHKQAFGYAAGLRMVRGRLIVDLATNSEIASPIKGGAA
jgi:hypothetical protein